MMSRYIDSAISFSSPALLIPSSITFRLHHLFSESRVSVYRRGERAVFPRCASPRTFAISGCSVRILFHSSPSFSLPRTHPRRHDVPRPLVDSPVASARNRDSTLHRDGGGDGPGGRSPPGILRTLHEGFKTARVDGLSS